MNRARFPAVQNDRAMSNVHTCLKSKTEMNNSEEVEVLEGEETC